MLSSLQNIIADCGVNITRCEPVHGGDINRAFCLYENDRKYFLKVNDAALYPKMFQQEAKGLDALRNHFSLSIPLVIKSGLVQQEQYLLLEWIERGNPNKDFWKNFGAQLAFMHQIVQPFFGWEEDNYIGSLPQLNQQHTSWHSFYANCRIMPLVERLFDAGAFSKQDAALAGLFCLQLENSFPAEQPALLHGDLWSGNFMITENGHAAIYDPAVYFGHREMDIGMTKLFGGFDEQFYHAYNNVYPLAKGWQQRIDLTQLYPVLVHAVLFGGHYIGKAKATLRQFS